MKPELMRGICQAEADAARRTDASPSLEVVPGIQAFLPTSAADCSCDEALLPAVSPAGPFCAPRPLGHFEARQTQAVAQQEGAGYAGCRLTGRCRMSKGPNNRTMPDI